MKTAILFSSFRPAYKNFRNSFIALFLITQAIFPVSATAQCTSAQINWDNLEYFHSNGTYAPFVTAAMRQTQRFAIGNNSMTIATTIPVGQSVSQYGDIGTHTGEIGAYGTGDDLAFVVPGLTAATITLTFENVVSNLQFSLFDIDQKMNTTVAATNASATGINVTLTKPAGAASAIQLNGNAAATTVTGLSPVADLPLGGGSGTDYPSTGNLGTVNVDVTGPVKTVTITFLNSNGTRNVWLSDITACVTNPGFTTNYYQQYTQPYAGQPAYFLANPDTNLNMYIVDPVNATADRLFTEPGTAIVSGGNTAPGGIAMNSVAYDPIHHWVYYIMNGSSSSANNKSLRKWDITTDTRSVVVYNVGTTLGIPTFTQGIEAASAAFYDTCLYLGIEGSDAAFSFANENVIWRIEFDASGNALRASQVYATPISVSSGQPNHDWGDIIVRDGTIVSHASNWLTPYRSGWTYYNMQTQQVTNTYTNYIDTAGQLGQIWNGTVYRIDNRVMPYTENSNTTGTATAIAVTSCSPSWNNRAANDASCPFRPPQDFGDAPSSYDPVALSVAANQKACNNSTLRIGSAWGDEWNKNATADASGDDEEDGAPTVTVMVSDGNAYNHVQDVTVLNNTGATAYLAGWLDYNADGDFDASESVVVTVPSSATPQTMQLGWTGITVAIGTPNTFLRVRLYSGLLTASNATGWLADGETEDYPVLSQATPLVIELLDFNASATTDKNVLLTWKAYADGEAQGFEVQRSKDQHVWEKIGWLDINSHAFTSDYSLLDQQPIEGKSYYRLKMVEKSGSSRYSNTRVIQFDHLVTKPKIFPNPTKKDITVSFNSAVNQTARLNITSLSGEVMIRKSIVLNPGDNRVQVSTDRLSNGLYILELITPGKTFINKLTVSH